MRQLLHEFIFKAIMVKTIHDPSFLPSRIPIFPGCDQKLKPLKFKGYLPMLVLPLCRLFSTRCRIRAVFPVPGPPLMMTPLLVGRCEVRMEWSSRKIHCLPINVDWWLEEEDEENEERGTSNCNGFSDRNTCCCRFIWLWLLTSCKCLSLNFWLEVALLQTEEEAALDMASSSSPPPCWWLP